MLAVVPQKMSLVAGGAAAVVVSCERHTWIAARDRGAVNLLSFEQTDSGRMHKGGLQVTQHLPRLFIGSSREGRDIVNYLQAALSDDCEAEPWNRGVFGLSGYTMPQLLNRAQEYDYAALVLTPDDVLKSREMEWPAARDNVLLEAGLFAGVLGLARTFLVTQAGTQMKIPSDLEGLSRAEYKVYGERVTEAGVNLAATRIRDAMRALGPRPDIGLSKRLSLSEEELGRKSAEIAELRREVERLSKFAPKLSVSFVKSDEVDISYHGIRGIRRLEFNLRNAGLSVANRIQYRLGFPKGVRALKVSRGRMTARQTAFNSRSFTLQPGKERRIEINVLVDETLGIGTEFQMQYSFSGDGVRAVGEELVRLIGSEESPLT